MLLALFYRTDDFKIQNLIYDIIISV